MIILFVDVIGVQRLHLDLLGVEEDRLVWVNEDVEVEVLTMGDEVVDGGEDLVFHLDHPSDHS